MSNLLTGRLMCKEKLAKKFTLEIDGEEGYFLTDIKIKGVKEDIRVKVKFYVIHKKYIQLWSEEVVYASASLGEKRMDDLLYALRKEFYRDEKFLAPFEVADGYVYGTHYAFSPSFYSKKGFFVEKINTKDLEKIAVDSYETDYYGRPTGVIHTFEYFYDKTHKRLLEREVDSEAEKKWKADEKRRALEHFHPARQNHRTVLIDEHHSFYQASPVLDEENIRLLVLNKNKSELQIETFRGNPVNKELYTLKELIEEVKLRENVRLMANLNVPLKAVMKLDHVTLLSDKIIGTGVPTYPIGTWVKKKENELFKIVSERKGKSYTLCAEGDYYPRHEQVSYELFEVLPEQVKVREDQPLIQFYLHSTQRDFYGFGYVTEETPHFYKVKPLEKSVDDVAHNIQRWFIDDYRYLYSDRQNIEKKMKNIHGEDLDFVFVPKDRTRFVPSDEVGDVVDYYEKNISSTENSVLENLLQLAKTDSFNKDYFLYHFHSYLSFENMTSIVKKVTDEILDKNNHHEDVLRNLYQWFEKMDIKKRFKATS